MTLAADVTAAAFALLIPVLALVALMSRSMLTIAICVGAAGVTLALVALGLNHADAALAGAVALGAWAPLALLALMLLTARAAKESRRSLSWLAALPAAALAVGLPFVQAGASRPVAIAAPEGVVFWLSLLMMASASACVGLLAYGERGGFHRADLQ